MWVAKIVNIYHRWKTMKFQIYFRLRMRQDYSKYQWINSILLLFDKENIFELLSNFKIMQ